MFGIHSDRHIIWARRGGGLQCNKESLRHFESENTCSTYNNYALKDARRDSFPLRSFWVLYDRPQVVYAQLFALRIEGASCSASLVLTQIHPVTHCSSGGDLERQ